MSKLNLFFLSFLDVIFFVVCVTFKILIYGRHMETGYIKTSSLFIPAIAPVIIAVSLSLVLKVKTRSRILYIFNIVISSFIVSDIIYFRYFKDIISLPVLISGFQLGAVKSSVSSLIDLKDFLYFADIVLIIPFINRYVRNIKYNFDLNYKIPIAVLLLFMGITLDFKSFYGLSKEQPRLLSTMYNKVYITRKLGILNYHCLDIYNSISANITKLTPVSREKLEDINAFMDNNKSDNKKLKGYAKGKNLIMIQVEALQEFVIDASINGQEITPNLNRWMKRSEYFDNFYYQVAAGGTSDAEFMTNNSMYPASAGAVYFLYSGNEFNAMPENFKNNGYSTAAFHGFRENFWNRDIMYKKFGFDNFYGEKSYKKDESIGLGLSDRSFLEQSLTKLNNMKQPYYAFLITLTSHYPYDAVDKYGDFDVGDLNGTLLGNYLKAIHYTDEQLGMFLDSLDKNGTLENSVVMLYGDHYAIPKDKEQQLFKFLDMSSASDVDWEKLQKVPLLVHFPDESVKGVNDTYGGEMDIYPTVCNLFDLPGKNMFGKDLFNPKNQRVIFRNGSFIDENYYYSAQDDVYYSVRTRKKLPENSSLKKEKDSTLDQLGYSDYILRHDAIDKLNK
ncbi:LTA synthase family protein [Clostridium luticellarii]|uniref:Lipoteichoic acid synthase 1 n=1 Tax=Clostridium luticellarii TaxID=1691940 RepID=A0A2T0BMR6_9CLOT|nr:LTA synthase family protein [Clostridium luticellarii]MCI1944047.1 LTA synthase family protein [Clostridium luticellarii]MCI1967312.1 LTA synthase family protein [Clostridium luticellarii]MCI1995502.1 LTA synthase family protein [Clostridium luticellarii]MCI2039203.1 LTA synthase family protein [Clostridium luticellarii]PRR85169.1 Lipoteichoic acid synthase 1 [Clostridium luticellarii]